MDINIEDIEVLEQQRAAAINAGDVTVLDRITDAAYVHVDFTGALRTRAAFLAAFSAGRHSFSNYCIDESLITVFGHLAVASGRFRNVTTNPDRTVDERNGRHIRLWVQRDHGWKNIYHQATRIIADAH